MAHVARVEQIDGYEWHGECAAWINHDGAHATPELELELDKRAVDEGRRLTLARLSDAESVFNRMAGTRERQAAANWLRVLFALE